MGILVLIYQKNFFLMQGNMGLNGNSAETASEKYMT